MPSYPYARVAHLLGIDRDQLPPYMTCPCCHSSTTTPTTITARGDAALYSYDLCILYRDHDDYYVYEEPSSPTTNRHIRTVRAVLESQGYRATDVTHTHRVGTYRQYKRGA